MLYAASNKPRLSFLHGRKVLTVHPAQIIRMEAKNNYTRVFFTDHPPILMAKVLRIYDEILVPHGFVRIHRSHLVNVQHVEEMDQKGILRMKDSSEMEISRRKKREVYTTLLHA
jgi:two-component system LytT family response regulator